MTPDERKTAIEALNKALASCEGEQYKFEEWARQQNYDMSEHPLHYIFTDPKTNAARMGWNAALEYARRAASALAALERGAGEVKGWRCFHCDEVFTNKEAAQEHFGCDCYEPHPACKLNSLEGGLLKLYREAQEQLTTYRTESDETSKFFYKMGADHYVALRKAEQEGYDKGLADGRALAASPSPPATPGELDPGALNRVAEIFYNDFFGARGGDWSTRNRDEIIVHQCLATARAAIRAYEAHKAKEAGADGSEIARLLDQWADALDIPSGKFVNEDLRHAAQFIRSRLPTAPSETGK